MSKKWFHPTNVENQKRKYLAEQKSAADKKRQQELRDQYEREQEIFSNKELMGDEKSKLGLAFMYQAPGSLKDNQDKEPVNEDNKLELINSRRTTRPDLVNQRCLKCKRLGHVNTDKVCPLYGKSRLDVEDGEMPDLAPEPLPEVKPEPKEVISDTKENRPVEEETEITLDMLRVLPKKEKKVLLKRLKKLEKKLRRNSD